MKTKLTSSWMLPVSLGLWMSSGGAARATLPEPDNVVYGTIAVGGTNLTASRTNFVVEAYRTTDMNHLLASYRMGANPRFGNRYAVALSLETVDPNSVDFPLIVNPLAFTTNERVTLIVKELKYYRGVQTGSTNHFETNLTVSSRGFVTNIDFGISTSPEDDYAAWLARFGLAPGSEALDKDGDGASNYSEYVAGTNPENAQDQFQITISRSGNAVQVAMPTRTAQGVGYHETRRFYTLQSATNLVTWVPVPGYHDVLGEDQTIHYTNSIGGTNASRIFFRGSIWLETP